MAAEYNALAWPSAERYGRADASQNFSNQPSQKNVMTTTIGIYVFDGFEVLDFAGPFEVFTTAARLHCGQHAGASVPFVVRTIGSSSSPVYGRAGLMIQPDAAIDDHPSLDVLVVPGGVVTAEMNRSEVLSWIAAQATRVKIAASVCTGAFLLAKAGVLDDVTVTTHWEDLADLQASFPNVHVVDGVRWVDQGNVVTSAGISAGIDMSLHIVERFQGRQLALQTARQMDFAWAENEWRPNNQASGSK